MTFTGIIVTTHGTGNDSYISMHNITVFNSAPVTEFGILTCFFDDVHNSTAILTGVSMLDGWDDCYHTRGKHEVLAECSKRQQKMLSMANAMVGSYTAIMIDVRTSQNTIRVIDVQIGAGYAPNGSAVAVYFKGQPQFNHIYLGKISAAATGNTVAYRNGLDLLFAGRARENIAFSQDLIVVNSTTDSGGGGHLLFTDHCIQIECHCAVACLQTLRLPSMVVVFVHSF